MDSFKDKVVIITGASRGIGRQTAIDLAGQGAKLVILARTAEQLKVLKDELAGRTEIMAVRCDVSDRKQCEAVVKAAMERFGQVDVLVNNAGFGMYNPVSVADVADFENQMKTNYFGTVYFTKAVLPGMLERKEGHIVNIASIAGKIALAGSAGYCASKFAVVGFTQSMQMELDKTGVHAHLICPGSVDTDFFKSPGYDRAPSMWSKLPKLKASEVSKAIEQAVLRNKDETIIPGYYRPAILLKNLAWPLMRPIYSWATRK